MAKLDRNQPFGEVTGSAGLVRYSQNHKDFDCNGNELDADGKIIEDDSEHPKIIPTGTSPEFPVLQPMGGVTFEGELPDEDVTATSGKPPAKAIHAGVPDPHYDPEPDAVPVIYDQDNPADNGLPLENDPASPNYHKLPVVQLKEIMDSHGEPYVNKAQAVEFLQNKDAQ